MQVFSARRAEAARRDSGPAAWPVGAARPDSGKSSAMRSLPDGVVSEPTWGLGAGGGGAVVVLVLSPQAARSSAAAASAKEDKRIGANLRRSDA